QYYTSRACAPAHQFSSNEPTALGKKATAVHPVNVDSSRGIEPLSLRVVGFRLGSFLECWISFWSAETCRRTPKFVLSTTRIQEKQLDFFSFLTTRGCKQKLADDFPMLRLFGIRDIVFIQ